VFIVIHAQIVATRVHLVKYIIALSSGQIEIAYALYGDLNLDGVVNGSDFSLFAAHFGHTVTGGWEHGDFDYTGVVNGIDFSLLDANFGKTASVISPAAQLAAATSETSRVPEVVVAKTSSTQSNVDAPSVQCSKPLNKKGTIGTSVKNPAPFRAAALPPTALGPMSNNAVNILKAPDEVAKYLAER
jgi:hypothetical protein